MEDLTAYPRPNVAVDVAVLTVIASAEPRRQPGQLAVLVQERLDEPRGRVLPGRFLREGETVRDSIEATLRDKAHLDVTAGQPRLLRVFDSPDRDPRGWTLSLAHALVLPPQLATAATGTWVPIDGAGSPADHKPLLFDHDTIVREAAASVRARYELDPDPDGLLTSAYSLADLKQVHEAVLGEMLQRDTFRRRMAPRLTPAVGEDGRHLTRVDGGRPARLWAGDSGEVTDDVARRLRLPRA
jgi:ADP-ribose pyrophosphatase YjhB (NUDIX family)